MQRLMVFCASPHSLTDISDSMFSGCSVKSLSASFNSNQLITAGRIFDYFVSDPRCSTSQRWPIGSSHRRTVVQFAHNRLPSASFFNIINSYAPFDIGRLSLDLTGNAVTMVPATLLPRTTINNGAASALEETQIYAVNLSYNPITYVHPAAFYGQDVSNLLRFDLDLSHVTATLSFPTPMQYQNTTMGYFVLYNPGVQLTWRLGSTNVGLESLPMIIGNFPGRMHVILVNNSITALPPDVVRVNVPTGYLWPVNVPSMCLVWGIYGLYSCAEDHSVNVYG